MFNLEHIGNCMLKLQQLPFAYMCWHLATGKCFLALEYVVSMFSIW